MLLWHSRRLGLRALSICVSLAAASACFDARAADYAVLRPDKLQSIERAISYEMARCKVPAIDVAIGEDLRLAWSKGFGLADVENSIPASPVTVYRIGSITKSITAVAAMQLFEHGKLDLDAPIQKYVPSFPRKQWPITARELLAHTSGVRHYVSTAEINSTRHYDNLLDPLRLFGNEPLLFEPGTHYAYSTYGYNLLGAAIEAASGTPFLEYLRRNIFVPAHMEQVRQDSVSDLVPNRARGYRLSIDGTLQNAALADTSNKLPGGGLIATAEDLVRFAIALERGLLVKPETRSLMFSRQRLRDGQTAPWGLGWEIIDRGGRRWVGHAGAQQGISTFLILAPEAGLSVAVLANLEAVDLRPLSEAIAGILLDSSR